MKSNEIVQEGVWDNIAHPLAYAKGVATAGSTGAGQVARTQNMQQIEAMAKQSMQYWHQQEAALEAQGVAGPAVAEALQRWASQYFKIQAPEPPPMVNDALAFQYIKKCVALKMAPPPAASTTTPPVTGGKAPEQPAADTTAKAEPAAAAPAQPAARAQQPQANPAHAIFQDPAKFTAEFNKYIQSTGLQQLVNFKLKDVLKNMWMRSGGTRVESKNNKGKRV